MDLSTVRNESQSSGVSWGAVVAGAFVAAALSLALLALGTGIGLSSVSPWAGAGAPASTIGWRAIGWLVLMQIIASSVGGYLAGRLRTKWVGIHTHEVYFRDTAHGFLAWSVGLVITAAFLTSAAALMLGDAGRATVAAADASMSAPSRDDGHPNGYLVDRLLRTSGPRLNQDNAPARAEIGLIFVNDIRAGSLPSADETYVAQVVAARTGASQADAERQVADAYAQAQQMADTARKATAHAMYWTFFALLVGAFCAAVAATIGGDQRDHVAVV